MFRVWAAFQMRSPPAQSEGNRHYCMSAPALTWIHPVFVQTSRREIRKSISNIIRSYPPRSGHLWWCEYAETQPAFEMWIMSMCEREEVSGTVCVCVWCNNGLPDHMWAGMSALNLIHWVMCLGSERLLVEIGKPWPFGMHMITVGFTLSKTLRACVSVVGLGCVFKAGVQFMKYEVRCYSVSKTCLNCVRDYEFKYE